MTAEYLTAIAVVIGIAISFRTASHTELRSLFDTLRSDFDKYKKEAQDKEKEMEKEIKTLTVQNENYKRYITRLIAQLEKASIIPVSMDE